MQSRPKKTMGKNAKRVSHFFLRTMFLSAQRMSMRFGGARSTIMKPLTTLCGDYTQSENASLWNRDLIVDPCGRLTMRWSAADFAEFWPDSVQINAITTKAARDFLVNCTKIKADNSLHHDGELLTVFDEYHPKMEPLFAAINNMASYVAGKDGLPVNGGFHVRSSDAESQILRMCAVLPSMMLTNVMGIYFAPPMYAIDNAKKAWHEFTPVKYVWWALRRRLHMHAMGVAPLRRPNAVAHVLETMGDMDKVLNAMQMNNLAVVMCVDRLPTSGLVCSDETESQLHSLRQSFHALVISK